MALVSLDLACHYRIHHEKLKFVDHPSSNMYVKAGLYYLLIFLRYGLPRRESPDTTLPSASTSRCMIAVTFCRMSEL